MIKKILILGTAFMMCFGLFTGCGSNYEYKEGDFELTIEADKTEVQVGETVTITARLENLSGKDVRMQMSHTRYEKLEDMILVGLFEENAEHHFDVTSEAGSLKKLSIKKNEVITRTIDLQILELKNYETAAVAVFNAEKGYRKSVSIYSKSIKIIGKENA